MGLVFTVLYIVLTIISPEQFGPAWANYHVLEYLAVITALLSLPNVLSLAPLKSSIQTYLLLGFTAMIGVSQIANHWVGGALQAWLKFLPAAAVYFFIVANVTTVRRLKIVTLASVAACLGLVVEAFCGYYAGFRGDMFVMAFRYFQGDVMTPILRLRGVGFLHDPNDFAQMLIIALALLFIAWQQGRIILNSVFVLLPAAVLLWAIYLTRSRGALLGLAILVLMAGYKRLGKVPSMVLTGILAVGMMALDFTGGRAIDASAGADRLELWASGLEIFKSAPIFGVGFGNFTDFGGHTAHNSFILPLAELGIIGATVFVALLVTTTLDLNHLIALRKKPALATTSSDEMAPSQIEDRPSAITADTFLQGDQSSFGDRAIDYDRSEFPEDRLVEVAQAKDQFSMGRAPYESRDLSADNWPSSAEWPALVEMPQVGEVESNAHTGSRGEPAVPQSVLVIMRIALVSFMATAWFLSRTYDTTVYLILGLATAVIALDPSSAEPRDHRRWIEVTLLVVALAIVFIYLVVRLRH